MRMSEKQQRVMAGQSLLFPSTLASHMSLEAFGDEKAFLKDVDLTSQDRKKLQKRISRT